jgi:D-glycero-D-manno-heptose 1,7-bisphosphate phosphatase
VKEAGSPLRPAVFFDRDGTLMEEVHYCNDPDSVRAFPGTAVALQALREAGYLRVMITNQSGIGRGTIRMEEYEAVQAELLGQVGGEIDAVYFCADLPDAATYRRKPSPGMVEEAIRDLGIHPASSWFVGDKDVDLLCGRAAGLRTILVRTGYGKILDCSHLADVVCKDVVEATQVILANTKERASVAPQ